MVSSLTNSLALNILSYIHFKRPRVGMTLALFYQLSASLSESKTVTALRHLSKDDVFITDHCSYLPGWRFAVKLCRRAESFTSIPWSQELLWTTQGLEQTFQQYITRYSKTICFKISTKEIIFKFYYTVLVLSLPYLIRIWTSFHKTDIFDTCCKNNTRRLVLSYLQYKKQKI